MPHDLELVRTLKKAGWKVKIYDRERLEPPHITILLKNRSWRLSLRDRSFLDAGDSWIPIDKRVKTAIEAAWEDLQKAWDRMYPDNPVPSKDDA
jgi:hypothetical protein